MLDDPNLGLMDEEDIKSWLDLVEAGSGSGRRNDTQFCMNAPRSLLTNKIDFDCEPGLMERATPEIFWNMMAPLLGHYKEADQLAIVNRSILLIAGRKRVMLRLPSDDPGAEMLSFSADSVAEDFLKEDNKPFLNEFRSGKKVKYPGNDEAIITMNGRGCDTGCGRNILGGFTSTVGDIPEAIDVMIFTAINGILLPSGD